MATSSKKAKSDNGSIKGDFLESPIVSKKAKGKKPIGAQKKLHKKKLNGKQEKKAPNGKPAEIDKDLIDATELLTVLLEIKRGNFDARMPINRVGLSGKVCDTMNEIILNNKNLVREFAKARNSVGKEGKLNQRIVLNEAEGEWKKGVDDLNALISDLVYPIREIDRVISAVAKGNLSQQIPIDVSNHLLQGEFARLANEVNDMVKQLNLLPWK